MVSLENTAYENEKSESIECSLLPDFQLVLKRFIRKPCNFNIAASKQGQNFKMHRLSETNILEVDPRLKILYFHKILKFFQLFSSKCKMMQIIEI